MKSKILNLIAASTLLFGSAYAADEISSSAPPAALPAAETASAPATVSPVTAEPSAAQSTQTPVKHAKSHKRAKAKLARSHDLDLRHCLDLPTYAEIAKCAGE